MEIRLMVMDDIRKELARLNLHPVNLSVLSIEADRVQLGGSLLKFWKVPFVVDGTWFLNVLEKLPDAAGGRATMEAFATAHDATPFPPTEIERLTPERDSC
jgi:hypothetical protein